jgi:hypothetical protein
MMTPDHLALLTVTGIGKSVANSALPNAPVVDDSNDRPPVRVRLAVLRARLSELWESGDCAPAANGRPTRTSHYSEC